MAHRHDRFIIAPPDEGLQKNLKPWLIADKAFTDFNNAYVFRGRVRRRVGSRYMNPSSSETSQRSSRLRILIAQTDNAGNWTGFVPGAIRNTIGMAFSIEDLFYTVINSTPGLQGMLSTVAGSIGTFDVTTNQYVISATITYALKNIYYYPAEPVMGFVTYNNGNLTDLPVIAFDRQFAYQYGISGWNIAGPIPPAAGSGIWTGSDSQFFWGTTWKGANNSDNLLFVTNNKPYVAPNDGIKYWNGATWNTLNPVYNLAGDTIVGARLVVAFKDRLVLLNTYEGAAPTQFFNRARVCQNGSPLAADAWREDIPGKGFYVDAPVKEQIITAQFLKDHLIVFFENSTWELVYSGNSIYPFYWQQINTELGAQSTFSEIPFDRQVLGMGRTGIHACTGANVARIDSKIPDEVFRVSRLNNGIERVCGVRDYFLEMVYWSFPDQTTQDTVSTTYPNKIFVYNYQNDTWAFNDDTVTAFGYFEQQNLYTWGSTTTPWGAMTVPWATPLLNTKFKQIIAGNQEGYTFIVNTEQTTNASVLQITAVVIAAGGLSATFTIMNHNLKKGSYIRYQNLNGISGGIPSRIVSINATTQHTITFNVAVAFTGTYKGGGTVERITPFDITTKQYNFYTKEGKNLYVSKVDFLVSTTYRGQFTVDFYTSSASEPLNITGTTSGSLLGTSIVETQPYTLVPYELKQTQVWHPLYLQAEGESVQLRFYLSYVQTVTQNIVDADFELHGMIFYAEPVSRLQ